MNEGNDMDMLVRFNKTPGFIKFIKLEENLSQFFGRSVDLVTESALSKYIRNNVLAEAKEIYCER